jgi:16S rRNA processing protein RimM
MTTPEDWVWLARIRHTQGRKGEVFADILTDFPEKFTDRKRLWLMPDSAAKSARPKAAVPAPREVELINHWLHKSGIVLHFAGVDSISAAEALKGLLVAVPRSERAALAEDEVYTGDLIGCTLIDVSGAKPVTIGEIESVDRTAGPVALLTVRGSAGEVLIPFARNYVRSIDLNAKCVEMALPKGLVELNLPGKSSHE